MSRPSLHFLSIIAEQKKEFYHTNGGLFDKTLPETSITSQEFSAFTIDLGKRLEQALHEKNLELPSDSREFIEEIILLKSEIDATDRISGGAEKRKKLLDIVKSEHLKFLILKTIHNAVLTDENCLIEPDEKGKTVEEKITLKQQRIQALIEKFTNYAEVADANFLTLYLQFLTRLEFFEDDKTKADLFLAFHSEIGECVGGMITRLEQYVGNNIIADKIATALKKRIADDNPQLEDFVHTTSFIQKFLLGIDSKDPHAIDCANYISLINLERLCVQALSGDYLEDALFLELKNFIQTIISLDDEEFIKTMLDDEGRLVLFGKQNHLIGNLRKMLEIISIAVSPEDEIESDARNLLAFQSLQTDLLLDETLMPVGKTVRQAVINALLKEYKFTYRTEERLIESYVKKSLLEISDNLAELYNQTAQDRRRNALIDDETQEKLKKLGVIYSLFLSNKPEEINLFEEKFLSYCDELCDYQKFEGPELEENAEKETFAITLKDEIAKYLPQTIRDFIQEKFSFLRVVNPNQQNSESARYLSASNINSAMKKMVQKLHENQLIIDDYNKQKKEVAQKRERDPETKSRVIVSLANIQFLIRNRVINPDNEAEIVITIPNLSYQRNQPDMQYWDDFKWNIFERYQTVIEGDQVSDYPIAIAKYLASTHGESLIKNNPQRFLRVFSNLNSANWPANLKTYISDILKSPAGEVFLAKYPQEFFTALVELPAEQEKYAFRAIESAEGKSLMRNNFPLYFRSLLLLNESEIFEFFSRSWTAQDLLRDHPQEFLLALFENSATRNHQVRIILLSQTGRDLLEDNLDDLLKLIANLADQKTLDENWGLGNLLGGWIENKLLHEKEALIKFLLLPENVRLITPFLQSEIGEEIVKNSLPNFIELLSKTSKKDCVTILFLGKTGKILLKNNSDKFFELLSDPQTRDEMFSCLAWSHVADLVAENYAKQFIEILTKLPQLKESEVNKLLESNCGQILLQNNHDDMMKILPDSCKERMTTNTTSHTRVHKLSPEDLDLKPNL